jgi:antitoxin ChpS
MHTTSLRKVGGSVMLVIPPVLLNLLHLKADVAVAIDVQHGRLIIDPKPRPHYTLDELLASSDFTQPPTPEEQEWIAAPPVGRELL